MPEASYASRRTAANRTLIVGGRKLLLLQEVWTSLLPKVRVVFRIAFSFAGVNAFEVKIENLQPM